jgi:hypothetical protein
MWPWLLAITVFFSFNVSSAAHLFAVHHLGLGMSRCRTCWGALIPICVLTGMVVDRVLRRGISRRLWIGYAAGAATLTALYAGLWLTGTQPPLAAVAGAAGAAAALWLWLRTRSPLGIAVLAVAVAIGYGSSTVMLRPRSTVCLRSSLTDALQATADGSCRYARVSPMTALPPNEECIVGLRSVHAYDSLSSRRYQGVLRTWSRAESLVYGRFFGELDRNTLAGSGEALSLAGVKYLISELPLDLPWLEPARPVGKFYVHESRLPPRMLFQTAAFALPEPNAAVVEADSRASDRPVRCLTNQGDHLRYVTARQETETLLFISQQYHKYWQARDKNGPLRTVAVNDFYQGVLLPPGTEEVELRFLPWGRWSWIPQALFVILWIAHLISRVVRNGGSNGFAAS